MMEILAGAYCEFDFDFAFIRRSDNYGQELYYIDAKYHFNRQMSLP